MENMMHTLNTLTTLSNNELRERVRTLTNTVEFNRRCVSIDSRTVAACAELAALHEEQRRRYGAQAPTHFPYVNVETNNGYYLLRDATWTPYTEGTYADGMNGTLQGLCEQGGETSRLFHATSHRNDAGKVKKFEYAHLSRLWQGFKREDGTTGYPTFHLTSCG